MKHLLRMMDLACGEIAELLNSADQLKYEQKHGVAHRHLAGKTLGMIFQKASTRARVSFEVGMTQLGGYPLFLSAGDLQLGRGEPIEDTAKVLSRYLDGIMIRAYKQSDAAELAKYSSVPVINGLTDTADPCQVLADLMTIREHKSDLAGLKLGFVGDGNNVCNSLIVGCLKVGMRIAVATPKGHKPYADALSFAKDFESFALTDDPREAVRDADVVYTDVWASMGQEGEADLRRREFRDFQVNGALMEHAKPDALVLHCLPARRGEEITGEIIDAHPEIFDQSENRLHAQKAVLAALMR